MAEVFVSLGSNIEREQNLRAAVAALRQRYAPLRLSRVYESRPYGFHGDNFYNLVAAFGTGERPERLKQRLTEIERRRGRTRGGPRFGPRTLDIDLLLYGDLVRHDGAMDLPHPDIEHYAFVLRPLSEVAPRRRHPGTAETYAQMWARFDARGQRLRAVALTLC